MDDCWVVLLPKSSRRSTNSTEYLRVQQFLYQKKGVPGWRGNLTPMSPKGRDSELISSNLSRLFGSRHIMEKDRHALAARRSSSCLNFLGEVEVR